MENLYLGAHGKRLYVVQEEIHGQKPIATAAIAAIHEAEAAGSSPEVVEERVVAMRAAHVVLHDMRQERNLLRRSVARAKLLTQESQNDRYWWQAHGYDKRKR